MADLVLRLRVDPSTGRRELVIDYESEGDALPMEHEEDHRRLAGRVVEGGLSSNKVTVTRATEDTPVEAPASPNPEVAEPVATKR